MQSNHPELAEVRRGSIAVKPPRTRAQPPDTPCSSGGGAVGEGSVRLNLPELMHNVS